MRKLVLTMGVSLDGLVARPGRYAARRSRRRSAGSASSTSIA
jgi:hypothetical protein